jgi:phosphoribosylaminoimidazole-succinocarboxamide synthase
MRQAITSTNLDLPCSRGKVRDVYDLGDKLWIISTDRISAFDWVLPNGIPDKGIVLTQLSRFWFKYLNTPNHFLETGLPPAVDLGTTPEEDLRDRSMLVRKAEVIPFECVVRGYLEGSGWREYREHGSVCGVALPAGLQQCDRLPEPIFTPATKAEQGHDENVSFETMVDQIGGELAARLRELSLDVYRQGAELAAQRGVIIADTKFEWGWCEGDVILIDEVLTPDSSRFWPADSYDPGKPQRSFDKQFVREWLMQSAWDRNSPPPVLPDEIVIQTREKYIDVYQRLTEQEFTF